jgi:hypothetical protein
MPRLPRQLLAVLLVLAHVLGPALHQAQHALSALGHDEGFGLCGHACCHAAAEDPAGEPERPADGLDAHERQGGHDHDCGLCSQLHRLHGFVAPSEAPLRAAAAPAEGAAAAAPAAPNRRRTQLPPARAPPRLQVC